jgi:hypothetical protein
MSCFSEVQGAKPKLEAGGLGWFCLRRRSLKQGISLPYKDREQAPKKVRDEHELERRWLRR